VVSEKKNPINIRPEDRELIFHSNHSKYAEGLVEQTFSNVFVTRSGIGLKNFKLVQSTIPHYAGKRQHFLKYALYQYFFRKRKKLKGNYVLIHNHWCPGFFHWVTEALPRLMRAQESVGNGYKLLLPETFAGYPVDSLAPFDVIVESLPYRRNAVVEKLLIPENTRYTAEYDVDSILKLRNRYHQHLHKSKLDNVKPGSKIYISRKQAKNRKVINEEEVIAYLHEKGFEVVEFENYTFWDQVSIMYHAKVIISIHGAGMTNQTFMPAGGYILEFQKRPEKPENFSNIYLKLANILGHNYLYQFCEPDDPDASIYEADLRVDIEILQNNLTVIKV